MQVQRVIAAPLPQVWEAIADLEAAPRWNRAWARVRLLSGPAGEGAVLRAEDEEGRASELQVGDWEPQRRVSFLPRPSPGEDLGSYWLVLEGQAITLEPAGEGATLVTMEARARARGLMGLVVGWLLWPGYQRRGLVAALDGLEALFSPDEG
ncbi:MAG TPA: SRPBCC family protein [Dehalococcoidia bacterium]|nr:SRPBCC family protein [Dehalococcoidia bacterium]